MLLLRVGQDSLLRKPFVMMAAMSAAICKRPEQSHAVSSRLQGVRSNCRMGLHEHSLIGSSCRFNRIWWANQLTDVVQGDSMPEVRRNCINLPGERWCLRSLFRQAARVMIDSPQPRASLAFSKFDELGKRLHKTVSSVNQIAVFAIGVCSITRFTARR